MKNLFLPIIFLLLAGCHSRQGNPVIVIQTNYGEIEAELYPAKAPKSVAAILSFIDSGIYRNASFYRVLNDDNQPTGTAEVSLIQGGTWGKNSQDHHPHIPHEHTGITGLPHTNGTLSLARQAPGTASTEFFICIGDQPGFNYGGANNGDKQGYAAFGKVISGMDIARKINRQPANGELLNPPVIITDIIKR